MDNQVREWQDSYKRKRKKSFQEDVQDLQLFTVDIAASWTVCPIHASLPVHQNYFTRSAEIGSFKCQKILCVSHSGGTLKFNCQAP